ncbi:hypothetical protein XA68_16617 [Ophiocordyceps unilateralis]|uniref:Uncharacterized protein n=1 Tax=Ophiocordyceps unilateralis TaxID=268505 RepID=A0A2A9P687_OPHUN|nr:hypothetical protein XA68_16617 [Ophiocordyceps unilateralis]
MQLKQVLVAALFSMGSVTAIPHSNPDNVEVVARDVNDFNVKARSPDNDGLNARDTAKTAATAGTAKESWHRHHRCDDDWYDWEGRCCRWHSWRREYYGCRDYWWD